MFPQLDIMYCNYSICNYVLCRGLWLPGNVFYHNKVSSYGSTIHFFLGGMQMFCGYNCNYNICNYVLYRLYRLYRDLQPPGNVFYHNKVSSHGSTHSYTFGYVVCRCSVGTTVTITSVIMCRTEVCGHLVMSFITIKSLHIDLLIHILSGMQMLCGHNWFIV